jgi:hypothetical protein
VAAAGPAFFFLPFGCLFLSGCSHFTSSRSLSRLFSQRLKVFSGSGCFVTHPWFSVSRVLLYVFTNQLGLRYWRLFSYSRRTVTFSITEYGCRLIGMSSVIWRNCKRCPLVGTFSITPVYQINHLFAVDLETDNAQTENQKNLDAFYGECIGKHNTCYTGMWCSGIVGSMTRPIFTQ